MGNELQAGLVGCGSLSQRGILPHLSLPDARQSVRLVAVADAVEERAREVGVAVRGGCFCNPGAAEAAFGFEPEAAARCLREAGRDGAFTVQRFAACMNEGAHAAVGAVRASLGLANNDSDIDRAMAVMESFVD